MRDELACGSRRCRSSGRSSPTAGSILDHPVWVDDKDFDVDRHLHRIGLPSPGGRRELAEICGHIASLPLDRSRPLWEMWVIENVAGTDAHEGGRLAVMTKVHHAAVDGVTGANLMSQLCSTEPDAPPPDPVDGVGGASSLEIAVHGAVKFATRPLKLVNVLPTTVSTVVDTVKRARSGLAMARAVRRAEDRVQRQRHRPPQHRVRPTGPRGHQDGEEPLRRQGQRRGDGPVSGVLRKFLRDRGELPDRRWSRWCRCRCTTSPIGRAATRCRGCSPAWRPHRRPRRAAEGHRRGEFRCQTTQFGDRCDAAAGLDAVRRAGGVRRRDARLRQPAG